MQNTAENLTQKERLAGELVKIRPDVTAKDREAYLETYSGTKATISGYLNGKVYDADTATQMLVFFRQRITNREKVIS
jgi:hypothetical protein